MRQLSLLVALLIAAGGCSDNGLRRSPAEPPPPSAARLELVVQGDEDADEAWFGELDRGESHELTLLLRSTGVGRVEVTGLTLAEGDFTLTQEPQAPFLMDPGAVSPLRVAFAPDVDGMSTAVLGAQGVDVDGAPVSASIDLRGDGLAPEIVVTPETWDFGTWPLGCAPEAVVTIRNEGRGTLVLDQVAWAATSSEIGPLSGLPEPGTEIPPDGSLPIAIGYLPTNATADSATLAVISNDPLRPIVESDWSGVGAEPEESFCCTDLPPGDDVEIDQTCEGIEYTPPADPWDIEIQWHWPGLSSDTTVDSIMTMPAVGHVTDDNGDGVVDTDDIPDIATVVFATHTGYDADGTLVLLDGATGTEHWSRPSYEGFAQVAIADANGDGAPEVLALGRDLRPRALDGAGNVIWTADASVYVDAYAAVITVADLLGDGQPEVIADKYVLNGSTGALLGTIPVSTSVPYRMPTVGDIDLDGEQEIVLGPTAWSLSAGVEWISTMEGTFGHWSALVQADGDPEAEVFMVGGDWGTPAVQVLNADGSVITSWAPATGNPSPPCAADFDGDGAVEVAWAGNGTFMVSRLDGTSLWTALVSDISGLAGCSGYDVDGDGVYEIVYADEETLYVFDGATGAVRWSTGGHASATLWEYPVIADVDADGSAEIVLVNDNSYYNGWGGIVVSGHTDDGWMPSGPTWAVHDFAVTNVLPDGSLPSTPPMPWIDPAVYRARPASDSPAADLQVEIGDVCVVGCDGGEVTVALQVVNSGATTAPAGVPVAIYKDGASTELLATAELPWDVPPLTRSDSFAVSFEATVILAGQLRAQVDDDGSGHGVVVECDEENNATVWAGSLCN